MKRVHVSDHPLIQAKLSVLRDEKTDTGEFRRLLGDIAGWLFFEASRDLSTKRVRVRTPLAVTGGVQLKRPVLLVPVLRAGLGMLHGILDVLPDAEVGFLGLQRNESTLVAESYYGRLPEKLHRYDVFLLDPMLATGGSSLLALDTLIAKGARHLKMISLVAAPEGVAAVHQRHPRLHIHTAAIDRRLNKIGYIVPGLGDAGDRLFGR